MVNRASIVESTELGSGGNGVVCEAWIATSNEPFALKRLRDQDLSSPELVSRFQREIRILQSLNHPNIITILESDSTSINPWFLMPLAKFSLERWMSKHNMEESRLRFVLRAVADALTYAHTNGVVHRDIKPSNILIMQDDEIVLTDFGLGFHEDRSTELLTKASTGRGTQGYAAPEQWANAVSADRRADIYALGTLLLHLSTNRDPLVTDISEAPREYQRIIQKCRETDPNSRYQSVSDLRKVLEMLWSDDEELLPAAERVQRLFADENFSPVHARQVLEIYEKGSGDQLLFTSTLHEWNRERLSILFEDNPNSLLPLVNSVCSGLPSSYPFPYFDTVGSFLEKCFYISISEKDKEYILARLLGIGQQTSRWNMGRIFAVIVSTLSDRSDLLLVRDVLMNSPYDALWSEAYILNSATHPIIRMALDDARELRESESTLW